MRYATVVFLSLAVACSGGEISVRRQFLAQSGVSVQFDTWVRSINNENQDSLALLYHQVPELRVLNADGTVSRGWEETRDKWAEFFEGSGSVNFVADGLEYDVVNGDVVLVSFRYSLNTERSDGTRDPTLSGLGTIAWIHDRVDDLWKIHMQHLSVRYRSGDDAR